ncbi:MAG: hypothetical protein QOI95_3245 [Acidimicrobiaceae bacterium]|jgi:hypothetical protein
MTQHAQGKFDIASWDEEPYVEIDEARKLTRASVTQRFSGDITGDGSVEWSMFYRTDGTADWVGMQRIDGQLGDRKGSFVLQSIGTFDGSKAAGDWTVVPGSGTDDLEGLQGSGRMEAPMGSTASYELDYALK